jgi:hypothetical protein
MSVIQYKCNVCKREIDLVENRQGLEVMSRCIITDGCRGKLYRISRLQDYIRGDFPNRVSGLEDYSHRKVLYNHTQSIAATEWKVEHNLGVVPSVQVLIDVVTESETDLTNIPCRDRLSEESVEQTETTDFDVAITGPNTLTITFDNFHSGLAQMIARSSTPFEIETAAEEEIPIFRLTSTEHFLTVATYNNTISQNSTVDFDIVYITPDSGTSITKTYTVPISISSFSPWSDFTNVLIQGRRYKVRSFNTFVSEMSDGTIPDGSSFYFKTVNSRALENQEVIILLSLSPYANIDKITNKLIDASRITASNSALSLFHRDRELFAFTPVIVSVFPPMREI